MPDEEPTTPSVSYDDDAVLRRAIEARMDAMRTWIGNGVSGTALPDQPRMDFKAELAACQRLYDALTGADLRVAE